MDRILRINSPLKKLWLFCICLLIIFTNIRLLTAQVETPYSRENQLDINNASYEEIAQLPVSEEIAKKIYQRITYRGAFRNIYELRQIDGINQELFNQIKSMIRVEPYRVLSATQEKIEQIYYRLDRWSSNEGVNDAFIDLWIEKALDPMNVNNVRYDELVNLQNVSPVDAVSIINHRNDAGSIRDARDLRGVNGLSYYGYSNARNFLDYSDPIQKGLPFHGHFTMRMDDTPFFAEEGEAAAEALQLANLYSVSATEAQGTDYNYLPNLYYKTRFSLGGHYKFGFSFTRYLNEPSFYFNEGSTLKIPRMKYFVGVENINFSGLI